MGAEAVRPNSTADTFEILADDLIRRLRIVHRKDPKALGSDVLEAARKLGDYIREHEIACQRPLEETTAKLIEGQGVRLRELTKNLQDAERRLVQLGREFDDLCAERESLKDALSAAMVSGEKRLMARLLKFISDTGETERDTLKRFLDMHGGQFS
jgi:hypothetical protein